MAKIICFEKDVLRLPAFRSLKKWAMLVYLDFLRKRQMEKISRPKRSDTWVIKNNGEIVYPYSEAKCKGIGPREFRNAVDELIEKGFLDIAHHGSGGQSGDMTKYTIDDRWIDYGTDSFRPARNPRRKDIRKGRGWAAYHANRKKTSVTNPLPEKAGSSNKIATPNTENDKSSSNKSDTPNKGKRKVKRRKKGDSDKSKQLSLWNNNIDTIL